MGGDQHAQSFRAVFGEEIADGREIAEALGHFFSIDKKEAGMHPDFHERFFAGGGFLLGDFRFVVREFQISGSAVNVILRSEKMFGNGGVFNVPTWSSFADFAVPAWLIFFGKFPQAEVSGIFLFAPAL